MQLPFLAMEAAPHPTLLTAAVPAKPRPVRLVTGLACLMALVVASGAATACDAQATTTGSPNVWHFVTEPRLEPPRPKVNTLRAGTAPGLIMLGPRGAPGVLPTGQAGAAIYDNHGNPVWFRGLSGQESAADLKVQHYRGRPVITWWEGTLSNNPPGTSVSGRHVVYDRRYRRLFTIRPQHGWTSDQHEFVLTQHGTAAYIATRNRSVDLTPYGGPKNGTISDSEIQEVDLRTGRLVFEWDLLDHVPLADSMAPMVSGSDVWDPYHVNSIQILPGGDLLISVRNQWAIYRIDRQTGRIVWKLGGSRSDFDIASNARFFWQHDARFRNADLTEMTLFDDGCCSVVPPRPPEQKNASGLVLALDYVNHRASLVKRYFHHPQLEVQTQGSLQTLPGSGGNVFLGWGSQSNFSEYTASGKLLYDAQLPGSGTSYRAFRYQWTATPAYPPKAAVRCQAGDSVVYASWNGATEVAAWRILASRGRGRLAVVRARVRRTGFETAARVNGRNRRVRVQALSAGGRVLGSSRLVSGCGALVGVHARSAARSSDLFR